VPGYRAKTCWADGVAGAIAWFDAGPPGPEVDLALNTKLDRLVQLQLGILKVCGEGGVLEKELAMPDRGGNPAVERWGFFDLSLRGPTARNPFVDVDPQRWAIRERGPRHLANGLGPRGGTGVRQHGSRAYRAPLLRRSCPPRPLTSRDSI
jgi:hypothetical protein